MLWNLIWIIPALVVMAVVGEYLYHCRPFHWITRMMRLIRLRKEHFFNID